MPEQRSAVKKVVGGTFGSLCSNAGGNIVAESVKQGVEIFATTAATSGLVTAGTAVLTSCSLVAAVPVLGYAALLAGSLWWQHREDQKDDQALREHFAEIANAIQAVKACGPDPAALELAAERIEAIHNRNRAVWAMLDGSDKADIANRTTREIMDALRPQIQDLLSEIRAANVASLREFDFRQAFLNLNDLGSSIHFEVTGLRADVQRLADAQSANHAEVMAALEMLKASADAMKQPGVDPTRMVPTPDILEAARIVARHSANLIDQARASIASREFAKADEQLEALERRQSVQDTFEIMTLKGDALYAQGRFDDAIPPYEAAFALRQTDLRARSNLAISLSQARLGNVSAKKHRAIEIHSGTLSLPNLTRWERSITLNNLGVAWQQIPTGDHVENLWRSIACFEEALKEHARAATPMDWAMTQNNLGIAWRLMPTGNRVENLLRSIACHENALVEYTRAAAPMDWAATQNCLGNAWQQMPTGDRDANLRRAIVHYEAALGERTRAAAPMEWAATLNNLGEAWRKVSTGDRAESLRRAIDCYERALKERTRAAAPREWAATLNNLGNAWLDMPTGDRAVNLHSALACYEEALKEYTREAAPMDWAATQNNLGIAWRYMHAGDRSDNLRRSKACFEEALKERTRAAAPMDWAMTQYNLGTALADLAEMPGQDRCSCLRSSIAASKAALLELTEQAAPYDHADTTHNLAIYRARYEQLNCHTGPAGIPFDSIPPAS